MLLFFFANPLIIPLLSLGYDLNKLISHLCIKKTSVTILLSLAMAHVAQAVSINFLRINQICTTTSNDVFIALKRKLQ